MWLPTWWILSPIISVNGIDNLFFKHFIVMNLNRRNILLGFLICLFLIPGLCTDRLRAQELNCKLNIVTTKITSGDKTVFETLQKSLNQFLNGRRWSKFRFQSAERIPCSMTIDVQEYNSSTGQITAYLSVQMQRPCFKSTYSSTLLNIIDKDFSFTYQKNDPIEYNDNSIGTNLTATLAFYAYIILGNYFDSGVPRGGDVFFERANNIVLQAQGLAEKGWKASERNDNNRYYIAENYVNSNYQAIHEVIYRYYRLGMDMMFDDPATARTNILEAMEKLNELKKQRQNLACITLFMTSRSDELVNIFQPAAQEEKQRATDLFNQIDPSNVETYKKIMGSGTQGGMIMR